MILFGPALCTSLPEALAREWLETNGLGGFASGTVAGAHTRRYHGLLVSALQPPVRRHLLLAKLEETLCLGGARFDLSTNLYPGAVHPQGYRYLVEFRLDPFPTFTFAAGAARLRKTVAMVRGRDLVVVLYELLEGPADARLELRPLVAFRDYHALTHENPALDPRAAGTPGCLTLQPYAALPPLHLHHNAEAFDPSPAWYYRLEYPEERARGLDWQEDLFSHGLLRYRLDSRPAFLLATTERLGESPDPAALLGEERARRGQVRAAGGDDPLSQMLLAAADQFLVRRGDGLTVVAGYPWFTDWGRDTMIALPGLTLAAGRHDEARAILQAFAAACDQGMLPNRFADAGEPPEYNSVDAALWFVSAVERYVHATGDLTFAASVWPELQGVVEAYRRGTRYGIHVGQDGLLLAGVPGIQLTWMDAKVGDWVVTPRHGAPVEVNALWYNALRSMETLAQARGRALEAWGYGRLAATTRRAFNARLWNETQGCLYDVLRPDGPDPSIRPNQLLALSLPFPALEERRWAAVLDVVERHLLTSYGLRTLSPADPQYRGRYEGDQRARDGAYHQGTVWPWLLGPYFTARRRVDEATGAPGSERPSQGVKTREELAQWLEPLRQHLSEAGLGSISEVFDGDPPHRPRGCIAQAWSVAEVLRVYLEAPPEG